jgi:hypothetical protein
MDGIRSTPMQYPILGLLADKLKKAQQFAVAPGGYANPPAEILLNLLGVPAVQQTMERVAYGEPLTTGRGMTTQVRPEVLEAAMTLLPAAAGTARVAERGAMAAGRAGERMAERMVPQIMERGGMPASLLGDLATGSRSHIFIPATKDEAFQASKMLKSGKTEQEVWREIGVGKGVDGEWKKEISDVGSSMKGGGTYGETIMDAYTKGAERTGNQLYATSVGDVFVHPELTRAYPDLMAMETQLMPSTKTARGAMSKSGGKTMFHVREDLPSNEARSTMLHELQHAVQEKSNFAVGGSAKDFAAMKQKAFDEIGSLNDEMRDIVKWMDDPSTTSAQKAGLREQYDALIEKRNQLVSTAQIDPMDAYGHLMGEAEARLTQRRMDLTPEQRLQNYPFEYTGKTGYGFDVEPKKMIYMTPEGTIIERGLLGP